MLTDIRLQNFKNHVDTALRGLRRLNVLVGPNAVGKSSILQATYLIHRLGSEAVEQVFTARSQLEPADLVRGSEHSFSVSVGGAGDDRSGLPWRVELEHRLDQPVVKLQTFVGDGVSRGATAALDAAAYLELEGSQLRRASYLEALPPRVQLNGYGVASAVSYLMRTDPERHRELTQCLQRIVPSVHGLRTNPIELAGDLLEAVRREGSPTRQGPGGAVIGDELLFDTVDARGVRGAAQSDGTLIVLGLLTTLFMPGAPRLVLLDDVEAGLQPSAQRELIRVLRELTERDPRLQLLMTTHSPYILDEMMPDEVWILGRNGHGAPVAKRLADNPRAEALLRMFATRSKPVSPRDTMEIPA